MKNGIIVITTFNTYMNIKERVIAKAAQISANIENQVNDIIEKEKDNRGKRTPLMTIALTLTLSVYLVTRFAGVPFPMFISVIPTILFFGSVYIWKRKKRVPKQ